jgi:hypothetical protein
MRKMYPKLITTLFLILLTVMFIKYSSVSAQSENIAKSPSNNTALQTAAR